MTQDHPLNWIHNHVAGGISVGPKKITETPGVATASGMGAQPVTVYDSHEGELNWIEDELKLY